MNKTAGIVLAVGAVVAGVVIWKAASAGGGGGGENKDLWFSVRYSDWPAQQINIKELIELNPGTTESFWRNYYSSNGYTILEEYYL